MRCQATVRMQRSRQPHESHQAGRLGASGRASPRNNSECRRCTPCFVASLPSPALFDHEICPSLYLRLQRSSRAPSKLMAGDIRRLKQGTSRGRRRVGGREEGRKGGRGAATRSSAQPNRPTQSGRGVRKKEEERARRAGSQCSTGAGPVRARERGRTGPPSGRRERLA
jgi:hypothetical protein